MTISSFRIYVACLSSYNNGILHGGWINCDGKTANELQESVNAILATSSIRYSEEFAIHDHEGFPNYVIGESTPLDDVAIIVEALSSEYALGFEYLITDGYSIPDSIDKAPDISFFEGSVVDYAKSYLDDSGLIDSIPESLRFYFDYEKFARDVEYSGDVSTWTSSDGGEYVVSGG